MAAPIQVNAYAAIIEDNKILVIQVEDDNGIHYDLPGGKVEKGESLETALMRECKEEVEANITIGRLLVVWQYLPELQQFKYGPYHKIGMVFSADLIDGMPMLPRNHEKKQLAVKWIPISDLKNKLLLPDIKDELLAAISRPDKSLRISNNI